MDKKTWESILEYLRRCPIRKDALAEAKVTQDDLRAYFALYPDAKREFIAAFDEGIDSLEDEAIRRALIGVEEPVFGRDGLIGYKTVYANDLTKMILSAYRGRYRGETNTGGSISEEARNALQKVFSEWTGKAPEEASPTEPEAADKASAETKEEKRPKSKPTKERKSARSKFL